MSKRISELPSTASVGVADLLAVVQSGATKQAALSGSFTFGTVNATIISAIGNLSAGGTLAVTGVSTFSAALRAADGSAAAPSYSFANETDFGAFRKAAGQLSFVINGSTVSGEWVLSQAALSHIYNGEANPRIQLHRDGGGSGFASLAFGVGGANPLDLILTRDAANILAQRNGVNAQTLRLYATFTDTSNFARGTLRLDNPGAFDIQTDYAGTGPATILRLGSNGSVQWRIETTGHLTAQVDNVYDIGASGVNRPRDIHAGGVLRLAGGAAGSVAAPAIGLANNVLLGWKTVAGGANWENFIWFDSSDDFNIGTQNATRWKVKAAGHLVANTDNAVDIGASGATRPRTGYFGTSVLAPFVRVDNAAVGAAVADSVQVYSSDDAAGHTIPSFYCEGTNVLATGQADSASSVRVKMRVNGTVVTLLAI